MRVRSEWWRRRRRRESHLRERRLTMSSLTPSPSVWCCDCPWMPSVAFVCVLRVCASVCARRVRWMLSLGGGGGGGDSRVCVRSFARSERRRHQCVFDGRAVPSVPSVPSGVGSFRRVRVKLSVICEWCRCQRDQMRPDETR